MRKIQGVLLGMLLFCLTACDSAGKLIVPEEEQEFHFAVTADEAAKIPYTFSGEKEGWKVLLRVREGTESEKEMLLQQLENDRVILEENYSVHRNMTEKQYRMFSEELDRQKEDLSENEVYISILTGQYAGERKNLPDGETLFYEMRTSDSKILFTGGIHVTSLDAPWYLSCNTVQVDYMRSMFVPPLEDCRLVLQYGKMEVEIPLILEQKEE